MSQKIRRDKLVQLMNQWQSGDFDGVQMIRRGSPDLVTVRNNSSIDLGVGQPIAITGRLFSDVSQDQAIIEYLNYGVQLDGTRPGDSSLETLAMTAEPIRSGALGHCRLSGVFGAIMTVNNDGHGYVQCDNNGFYSAPFGSYRILGKAGAFAFLKTVCFGGHLIGEIRSKFTQNSARNATARVRYYDNNHLYQDLDCPSPMSKPDDVIPSGTRVILHLNAMTGDWEIIQAECIITESD